MNKKDRNTLLFALTILGLAMLGLFLVGLVVSTGYIPPWYL